MQGLRQDVERAVRPKIKPFDQPVLMSCLMCNTYTGCSKHENYKCRNCKQVFSWSYGAADDLPESCDGCWVKAHPEES